jgi:hypothetical protein
MSERAASEWRECRCGHNIYDHYNCGIPERMPCLTMGCSCLNYAPQRDRKPRFRLDAEPTP